MSDKIETNLYIDGQQDWITAVDLLIQTVPTIKAVDLIVEGCIGGNEWCAYWLAQSLPNSLYVGTDIAPALLSLTQERVDEGISIDTYEKLVAGQAQLKTDEGDSSEVTLRANCLSPALIQSLKDLSHAHTTMLVTFNGLVGLMGQDFVPGERKNKRDLTPVSKVVSSDLYDVQLHLTESENLPSLWASPVNVVTRWYYQAEQAAKEVMRQTIRIKDGLVILK